jgi:DNA-binding MarR family transcriptional regulator
VTNPHEATGLDPEEQQTWLSFAYMLMQLPTALDAQLQRTAGISLFEYQVLSAFSLAPDRTARLSKVAEFTGSSLSRLSNVITRLEDRGWLRRAPDPEDGRCTLGSLTEQGWATVLSAGPGHVSEIRRLVLDQLTKAQQQQLHRITQRVMQAVEPDRAPITERLPGLPHLPSRPGPAQPARTTGPSKEASP